MNTFEIASDAIEKDRDYNVNNENAIEFLRNTKTATVSFSQGKYISKIKKYAEAFPDDVKIVAENTDGSIVAYVPVKWIKISPPRQISEEQKEAARERLSKYWDNKGEN